MLGDERLADCDITSPRRYCTQQQEVGNHDFADFRGGSVRSTPEVADTYDDNARDARQSSASRTAQEVALGHGDIDWMLFLAVLEEIEYRSWLVIERESGDQRLADVTAGVAFLRRLAG